MKKVAIIFMYIFFFFDQKKKKKKRFIQQAFRDVKNCLSSAEIWVCGTGTPAKQFSSTWFLSISSIFAARSTVLSNCKLIRLIIVIDFHYGRFQIPYWDVLQNCEGQGQGLICHLIQINQNMIVANFCSAHIRSF